LKSVYKNSKFEKSIKKKENNNKKVKKLTQFIQEKNNTSGIFNQEK